jgi:phosphatidate cytidylyltransferase
MVYLGLLMSFLAILRLAAGPGGKATGLLLLFAVIFIAKMCDSGGFLIGKPFGRTPLAPLLSPTKTVEGAIGGVAFALLAAWLVGTYVQPWLAPAMPAVEPWRWLLFGGLIALAAMLGDLAESLVKRDMERKDAASWLPAFGGALDVIDSLLFAAPAGYLAWRFGLV